jgi:hypothetical protein
MLGRMSPPRTIWRILPRAACPIEVTIESRWRQAADFEQLEPEGLDLGEL